jgi:hypothetical protein
MGATMTGAEVQACRAMQPVHSQKRKFLWREFFILFPIQERLLTDGRDVWCLQNARGFCAGMVSENLSGDAACEAIEP